MMYEGDGNEDSTVTQNMSVHFPLRNFGSALAINESGQFAVLGGKNGLYIVDLDRPFDTPRTCNVVHQGMWEVGVVQWNPHHSRASFIASTANTNTLIWNIDERLALQSSFKAHDRTVQDLCWSPEEDNLLATCSADGNIHIWDTRVPKQAMRLTVLSVSKAALTQVKWNKVTSYVLASANDGEVRIWDTRKDKPLSRITAHMGKVTGLDWSYFKENEIITCGQDKHVKCWDINNIRNPKHTFMCATPIARARYTPFGEGVVSMAQRDDFSLQLWSFQDTAAPIHVFGGDMGHTDIVTAFDWRVVWKDGERYYQLVSWSKDQNLKLWRIDEGHLLECEPSEDASLNSAGTSYGHSSGPASLGRMLSPREETVRQMGGPSWNGLAHEFAQLKRSPIPGITIQSMDIMGSVCEVVARVGDLVQELKITFPSAYPHSAPPSFHLFPNPSVPIRLRAKLKELLSETADVYVNLSRPCLDQCLLQLASFLEKHNASQAAKARRGNTISPSESPLDGSSSSSPSPSSSPFLARTRDNFIPAPRTAGACFSIDSLVFFRSFAPGEGPSSLPRSYADMKKADTTASSSKLVSDDPDHLEDDRGDNFMEISKLYFYTEVVDLLPIKMDLRNSKSKPPPARLPSNTVSMHDIQPLLPISRGLGERYTLNGVGPGQAAILCLKNRTAASHLGRTDLAQLWTLIAHMTDPSLFPSCSFNSLSNLSDASHLFPHLTVQEIHPASAPSKGLVNKAISRRRHTLTTKPIESGAPAPVLDCPEFNSGFGCIWALHPFGRSLASAIFRHYQALGDVQTLAMLSAVLSLCLPPEHQETTVTPNPPARSITVSSGQSPVIVRTRSGSITIPLPSAVQNPAIERTAVMPTSQFSPLSTSFPSRSPPLFLQTTPTHPHSSGDTSSSFSLLDPAASQLHDHYRRSYAEILYRWGELTKHAEVLKFAADSPAAQQSKSLQMMLFCGKCGKMRNKLHCTKCHTFLFNCVICHTMVKGLSNFCFICGHGGHMNHMQAWFRTHSSCPTGCGCDCLAHANCVNQLPS